MDDNSPMLARLSAFVVWALVAGAIVFWGMRLLVRPTPAPAHAVAVVDAGTTRSDLSRLFGVEQVAAAAAPPPESTRFKLLGVLAPPGAVQSAGPGVALISVDGKPPRPYRAGARVEDRLVLQSVGLRTAALGPADGPAAFTLEIPRMPDAATGTLSPVDPSQLQFTPPPAVVPPPPPPPTPAPAPADAVPPGTDPAGVPGGMPPPGGPDGTPGRSRAERYQR
jgi:general secretion pathway protein C